MHAVEWKKMNFKKIQKSFREIFQKIPDYLAIIFLLKNQFLLIYKDENPKQFCLNNENFEL